MKKDTFYFSHDYNAATDFKILFLRQQLGMEGYGIYWYLVEQLAQSGGYLPLKIVPVLAMQMHTTEVKVHAVIKQFELFELHEEVFYSVRLNKNLEIRNSLSEYGKKGALKRWENKIAISHPNSHPISDPNAKEKKRKEKKRKEKIVEEIDYDILSNEILNSEVWIQNIAMQYKLDINFVKEKLDFFLEEVKLKDDWHKGIKEVKAHFINWLKIQKEKNSAKKENENETNRFTGTINAINSLLRK